MKKSNAFKILVSILIIVSLSLVGCSNGDQPKEGGGAKTIKLAFTVPMDDAGGVGAAKFQEILETESDGQFKVNLFPAGQQGSMKEHWESVQMGQSDIVYVPGSALETFIPEMAILDLPLLFPDYETAWDIIDNKLSEELNKLMNEKGFHLLGVAPYGYNQFHTDNIAINSVEDLKGLKMRTIPSPIKINQYKAWGASPTPIEFAELYTSLQSGVVDGGENSLLVIKTQKLYEVQKNITISDHSLFTGLLAINKKMYDGLSDEEKAWIQTAADANIEAQRKFVSEERPKVIELVEEAGVEVNELSDEAKKEFREKANSTYEMYSEISDAAANLLKIATE